MKYMQICVTSCHEVPIYPHHWSTMKHELPYFKNDLELSKIKKPTLIVHGDSDSMVPFSMAEQAASQIEGSTLRKVEGGNHCIALHDDGAKIFQEQVAFVKSHNQ